MLKKCFVNVGKKFLTFTNHIPFHCQSYFPAECNGDLVEKRNIMG